MTHEQALAILDALEARRSHLTQWDLEQISRLRQLLADGGEIGERDQRLLAEQYQPVIAALPADSV